MKKPGIDEQDEVAATLTKPLVDVSGPSQAPDRMSSGITGREAVARASQWWDTAGRHMVRPQVNFDKVRDDIVVRSAILNGLPWSALDRRERHAVVVQWHRTFVLSEQGKVVDERIIDPKARRISTKKHTPTN